MKNKNSDDGPNFIPYDDENIDHVSAGPDYGQVDTGSKSTAWSEIDSEEYDDYMWYISEKIINRKIKII